MDFWPRGIEKVKKFNIVVGDYFGGIPDPRYSLSNKLDLQGQNLSDIETRFDLLLKRTEILILTATAVSLKILCDLVDEDGFECLMKLTLDYLTELEYLINTTDGVPQSAFPGCAKMTSKIGGSVGGGNWKNAHGSAHYGRNFSVKWLKEIIASSGSFVEEANAADLIQRRQRSEFQSSVKGTLFTAIKANPDLVPSLLTLAMNDAMTYDKATKSGGPNGSVRFSSEISRPENKGLSAAMNLLEEAKKEIDSYSKGGPISFADLIQFAGCMSYLSPSLSCTLPTWPLTCSDTLESVIVFMWSVLYKSFVFTNMFIIKFMVDE
ncbi:uncharacterized protein LOC114284953 [Camellia sinensis]|uniref:uncharacterized protein LOC114284953 n=1 Tax=Camellia sinensis TaxID=4442 RepID=UPI00103571DD|nr:uncharacterized protein LOC114284953 [Camellia sinensis]